MKEKPDDEHRDAQTRCAGELSWPGRGSSRPTKVGSLDAAQPVLPAAKSMTSVSLDARTCPRLQ